MLVKESGEQPSQLDILQQQSIDSKHKLQYQIHQFRHEKAQESKYNRMHEEVYS